MKLSNKNTSTPFWKNPQWFMTFFAFIAIVISIASICRSCKNDERSAITEARLEKLELETNYNKLALEQRPRLTIDSKISDVKFKADQFSLETCKLKGVLSINLKILLVNVSDYYAIFRSQFYNFCPFRTDTLRQILLKDPTKAMYKKERTLDSSFFEQIELAPKDSLIREVLIDSVILDTTGYLVLHYLVLYENDLNCMFDTYYMNRIIFKPEDVQILCQLKDINEGLADYTGLYHFNVRIDEGLESYPSSILYRKENRDRIYAYFEPMFR